MQALGHYPTVETFVVATLVDRGAPLKMKNPLSITAKKDLKLERDFELTNGYTSMLYYYDNVNLKHVWLFQKEVQNENIM